MSLEITVRVIQADALVHPTDLLALKYAQGLYGVDLVVSKVLLNSFPKLPSELPKPGVYRMYDSRGCIVASQVVFIGVPPLREFSYLEIRLFGHRVLEIAASECPRIRSIALTVHGPGIGLDEVECFKSLVAGLSDGVTDGFAPTGLREIIVLEKVPRRALRFKKELDQLLGPSSSLTRDAADRLQTLASTSSKPLLFVAMPFRDDMADLYDYGILRAAERAGFSCGRADYANFTGDVLEWVRMRIEASTLVVADLSYANPNVYLEVGYAWGRGKKTVLMVRDKEELKFDVRGQRCLVYTRIKDLEDKLHAALISLE